jgi:hypothetical protein
VLYTPGQLRDSVGLSKEAFRHWKRVVPALASGRGHAPSFSPGDVLASAVLRRLTDAAGVRIGHLADISPAIFELCNASSWDVLQYMCLVIDLQQGTCVAANDLSRPAGDVVVVCALAPLVKALRFDLFNGAVSIPRMRAEPQVSDRRIREPGRR